VDMMQLSERADAAHGPMIKVNLHRPDDGNEGLWAKIETAEDAELYERDTRDDTITVILMNHALVNGPTWGMRFRVTTQGGMRPTIHIDEFIAQCNEQAEEYPKVTTYGEEEESADPS